MPSWGLNMAVTLNINPKMASDASSAMKRKGSFQLGSSVKSLIKPLAPFIKHLAITILAVPLYAPIFFLFPTVINDSSQYNLINDSTKVKDVFMLKTPTECWESGCAGTIAK